MKLAANGGAVSDQHMWTIGNGVYAAGPPRLRITELLAEVHGWTGSLSGSVIYEQARRLKRA